jgi:hypothetical protein
VYPSVGKGNENLVSHSEDLTVSAWSKWGSTIVTKPNEAVWNGIQMNEVENNNVAESLGPTVLHLIDYGSLLAEKYLTIMCYAQQVDEEIQGIAFAVDGIINFFGFQPLRWGDYPRLIVSNIQLPAKKLDGTDVGSSCSIVLTGVPTGQKGKLRVGAVRVLISAAPDNDALGEYIRTNGGTLRRGNGAGLGLPVSLVGLSGYLRPTGRPQLPLLNHTQIIGLASGGGTSTGRPVLGGNDVGYQYFDTTLGMPVWWSGTKWVKADSTS